MNKETLRELEKSENLRVSAIAALSINTDITFLEAEKKLNDMFAECKHPTGVQRHYEAVMDAEFNC